MRKRADHADEPAGDDRAAGSVDAAQQSGQADCRDREAKQQAGQAERRGELEALAVRLCGQLVAAAALRVGRSEAAGADAVQRVGLKVAQRNAPEVVAVRRR